ncbi:MAG: hypothetical protein MSB10_00445 [Clostridiales bacterium]|nr:hypothetical protein [Clostridiales bacterium]
MKMKKYIVTILALIVALMLGTTASATNSSIPEDVLVVAESGLKMVQSAVSSNPGRWGFSTADEAEALVLGDGYRVNYVGAEQVDNFSGNSITGLIDPNMIETWEFTLDLNKSPRLFLTIAYEDGAYRVVHYGGNAEEFGMAKSRAMETLQNNSRTNIEEETLIKASGIYYFVTTDGSNDLIFPVVSRTENSRSDSMMTISEFVSMLKNNQSSDQNNVRGFAHESNLPNEAKSTSFNLTYIVGGGLLFAGALILVGYITHTTKRNMES